jgi:DNA-binding PadR family transcriptional regulator
LVIQHCAIFAADSAQLFAAVDNVTIGSVYGTLKRLEEKGLMTSWRSEPEPTRGGRSRRLFRVEPDGERALAAAHEVLGRMWEGVTITPDTRGAR